MLKTFKGLLGVGPRPTPAPTITPELAAAVLLVETALLDGHFAEAERAAIGRVLARAFDRDEAGLAEMVLQAETLAETGTGAFAFTQSVKTLPEAQRARVIEGLYAVSLADGQACKFEEAYIRQVAGLLYVDDGVRAAARRAAVAGNAGA